ncbi:MAG: NAD(P)/FAD-dependent oxidoreductase [Pseudomonadota bacterium]
MVAEPIDVLVLGAGAAGLFCGAKAAARGRSVLVVDHAAKPAEKVRISGGGRCNFTNIHTGAHAFLSENPHFAKSALARYSPWDFCDLMAKHGLTWHEKTLGQLFCDQKSTAVIQLLLDELSAAGGTLWLETEIGAITHDNGRFTVETSQGTISASRLVVATGGLSIPKIGASGRAYAIAEHFGLSVIPPRPALVPLTFSGQLKDDFAALSGVSAPVKVIAGEAAFNESMLFTHRGLSGPAILQASSYWRQTQTIEIDLLPGADASELLLALKTSAPKKRLGAALADHLPQRLADMIVQRLDIPHDERLGDLTDAALREAGAGLSSWRFTPTGTEGWRTAEVTAGGIDTAELSSKTMEAKAVPGLFFIGECVDVTGWLGGYNFQWAWASAAAAAEAV